MKNKIETTRFNRDQRVRIAIAIAAVTMFVLSAGAPGATGW
ncbi:MAG: hypothetical protein R2851_20170 [Caldilineaceae bacterium]